VLSLLFSLFIPTLKSFVSNSSLNSWKRWRRIVEAAEVSYPPVLARKNVFCQML